MTVTINFLCDLISKSLQTFSETIIKTIGVYRNFKTSHVWRFDSCYNHSPKNLWSCQLGSHWSVGSSMTLWLTWGRLPSGRSVLEDFGTGKRMLRAESYYSRKLFLNINGVVNSNINLKNCTWDLCTFSLREVLVKVVLPHLEYG